MMKVIYLYNINVGINIKKIFKEIYNIEYSEMCIRKNNSIDYEMIDNNDVLLITTDVQTACRKTIDFNKLTDKKIKAVIYIHDSLNIDAYYRDDLHYREGNLPNMKDRFKLYIPNIPPIFNDTYAANLKVFELSYTNTKNTFIYDSDIMRIKSKKTIHKTKDDFMNEFNMDKNKKICTLIVHSCNKNINNILGFNELINYLNENQSSQTMEKFFLYLKENYNILIKLHPTTYNKKKEKEYIILKKLGTVLNVMQANINDINIYTDFFLSFYDSSLLINSYIFNIPSLAILSDSQIIALKRYEKINNSMINYEDLVFGSVININDKRLLEPKVIFDELFEKKLENFAYKNNNPFYGNVIDNDEEIFCDKVYDIIKKTTGFFNDDTSFHRDIYIDCDETICHYKNVERKYENALPIVKNIDKINKLYDLGHTITIWTARGTVTKIDYTELTKQQLSSWNVKYHKLLFGKPPYDLYIDDKSINSTFDWNDSTINSILSKQQYNYLTENKMTQLLLKQKEQLNSFFNNINQEHINNIVDIIISYSMIYFIGIGKSEDIAKYTSNILKSININSNFLNPANLSHGDIGGVAEQSLIFVYSKSGNTNELELPIFLLKKKKCFIILVSMQKGKLYDKCDFWIQIPQSDELDDMNTIPTTSITFYSIFTNLLVSLLIDKKNLMINEYKHNHVSGNIGYKLFTKVKDVYRKKDEINCHFYHVQNMKCTDIIFKITDSTIGLCVILNSDDTIAGIITDGTIRLYMINTSIFDLEKINIENLINRNPFVINNIDSNINCYKDVKYKYAPVVIDNKYTGIYKFDNF
jgi:arabinose-5-phosphate isomerase